MKKKVELIPLVGIKMGNKAINLGQSPDEVKSILGYPTHEEVNKLYYDELEFRMDFDKSGKLEFIEFQGPIYKNR